MGGVIDIRKIGGLRHRMPVTFWTFFIGCLAIAGVCPLAGFWSKDAILLAIQERSVGLDKGIYELLLSSALFGVMLIDFYMFRPFFMVFFGPEKIPPEAGRHAHESPGSMIVPLVLLAFGSLTVGLYFEWTHGFSHFLEASPSLSVLERAPVESGAHWRMGVASSIITLFGIALAAALYLGNRRKVERMAQFMNVFGLYSLSLGKFFIDPLYEAFVVWPLLGIARLAAWFDRNVIDATVDFCGRLPGLLGAALRPAQNGLLQFYALAMVLGLLALLGALLM
jgi:NADH-quinone oxidoreductase subunit L